VVRESTAEKRSVWGFRDGSGTGAKGRWKWSLKARRKRKKTGCLVSSWAAFCRVTRVHETAETFQGEFGSFDVVYSH